jgi:hypothetical protein
VFSGASRQLIDEKGDKVFLVVQDGRFRSESSSVSDDVGVIQEGGFPLIEKAKAGDVPLESIHAQEGETSFLSGEERGTRRSVWWRRGKWEIRVCTARRGVLRELKASF